MRTSCLVNNYNYEKYIIDAVDSALMQTVPFDEVIVVDDGSSDDSLSLLNERFGADARVKIIAKKNGGQLSSFNEGFLASSGDIIFFLDADDLYEPNYLEEALNFYGNNKKCDFLYCALTEFGEKNGLLRAFPADRHLGFTVVSTLFLRKWLGAPTSAISMHRNILEKVLPMPAEYLSDWRVRADDCLVWGASIAGAYKCYCDKPLVRYRVHGNNHFAGRKFDHQDKYKRSVVVNRLFGYLGRRNGCEEGRELYKLAKIEFRTIREPVHEDFRDYVDIIFKFNMSFVKKVGLILSLWKSYRGKNRKYR